VRVDGAGLVDVAVYKGDAGAAVALVNLTNPMAMRGPIRETLPLPPQTVSIAVPPDRVKVRLLVAGTDVKPTVVGGRVEVVIPPAGLLEVVHVDWSEV